MDLEDMPISQLRFVIEAIPIPLPPPETAIGCPGFFFINSAASFIDNGRRLLLPFSRMLVCERTHEGISRIQKQRMR
jgi:hypothetical protein